jgi:hypothetical protein
MLNLMSFSPSNFGRYVSQTEQCMNETSDINEWTPPTPPAPPSSTTTPPPPTTTINDIPSLISLSTTSPPPPPIISTSVTPKIIIPSSIMPDDVEPLPFPQHGPGPIQRPNKLTCAPTQPLLSPYLPNSIQSPGTPDVLDQLNRLLDHQNSSSTIAPSTPNVNNSSISINDLGTPNIPWTTFSSTEWPSKYESTWPLTNIQTPTVSLTAPTQNPFVLMSTMNEQPRQPTREDPPVWSSVLGTATPRLISSSTRTQRASTWNELFQSTVPSSNESAKLPNGPLLKYWPAPDPPSADVVSSNGHVTQTNNPFWHWSTLSTEPVVASSIPNPQQVPSTAWWPNSSSDENNNKSQTNHLDNDTTNNRDQSRWDFAR